jgi:inhibitor of KinA sporulation pathway (predicted exonuclease)
MILMALDLELNQPSGKIIQVGAVAGDLDTGEILARFGVVVNPLEPIDPFIVELTGVTQERADAGVAIETAYTSLCAFHALHGCFTNALTWGGGDTETLRQQSFEGTWRDDDPGLPKWPLGRRWIDCKTLYVSWRLAHGKKVQGGLARALTKFGLRFEGRKHDAVDDAANTFRFYHRMVSLMRGIPHGTSD